MTVNQPSTSFSILRAQQIVESVDQRVLIVGQMASSGNATSGQLLQNVQSGSANLDARFGLRSHISGMIREFKKINDQTSLDVIPLADNGGAVAGTSVIGFVGEATESGRVRFGIASDANHGFNLDILAGDTSDAVAAKLVSAIATDRSSPFTSTATGGDVTCTAVNAGTLSNDWTMYVDGAVSGITISLNGWSGGATDPVLSDLFDAIAGRRYQTIVWPSAYDTGDLASLLTDRLNVSDDILQGVAFITSIGTPSQLSAQAAQLNNPSICLIASKRINNSFLIGSAHREMPDIISARVAAVRSIRFTENAPLTSILTTPAPLDQFGGRGLASLPYFNTVVPGMPVIFAVDQFSPSEVKGLAQSGISHVGANRNFTAMVLGEMATTNISSESGDPDDSFRLLNTVDTVVAIRDAFFLNFRRRYAQSRLTNDDLVAGRDLANQQSIEAFTEEIYQTLAEDTIVQSGEASLSDFKANRVVEVDVGRGRVTFNSRPLLITGLRVIIGTVQINFGN